MRRAKGVWAERSFNFPFMRPPRVACSGPRGPTASIGQLEAQVFPGTPWSLASTIPPSAKDLHLLARLFGSSEAYGKGTWRRNPYRPPVGHAHTTALAASRGLPYLKKAETPREARRSCAAQRCARKHPCASPRVFCKTDPANTTASDLGVA